MSTQTLSQVSLTPGAAFYAQAADPRTLALSLGSVQFLERLGDSLVTALPEAGLSVGAVGAAAFFSRVAGAVEIADSTPGLYAGRVR